MKRTLLTALLLLIIVPCLNAQKKEIAQARTYIKSGADFDKAEQLMTKLLADSANARDIRVREVLAEAVRRQYEKENEKLYAGKDYDTTALFTLTRRLFLAFEGLDSIDAMPPAKGKPALKFRRRNAEYAKPLRRNLFNGGIFFIRKRQFDKALPFMESYIDCTRQPLFTGITNDGREPAAAFWALYCGYMRRDTAVVLRHAREAMRDTAHLERTYCYLAETYRHRGDTANYALMLRKGFGSYPKTEYFYTHLLDYYNDRGDTRAAASLIDRALAASPGNHLLMYAKSSLLLNTGDYGGCVSICDTLIAQNDTLADAYYNAGVAYVNMAFRTERDLATSRKALAEAKDYYRKALPYMERYRALCPKEKDKWAAALYNIYLRLNMGKQFEEIDRLLR